MKLYYFSEMPHHEYPDAEGDKYPSLRLAFPNKFFDPGKAAENYQRYFAEYELADQVGFDGLMINEHHSTPSCVDVGVNMPCNTSTNMGPSCAVNLRCVVLQDGMTAGTCKERVYSACPTM